jgi:hypothetical protein
MLRVAKETFREGFSDASLPDARRPEEQQTRYRLRPVVEPALEFLQYGRKSLGCLDLAYDAEREPRREGLRFVTATSQV